LIINRVYTACTSIDDLITINNDTSACAVLVLIFPSLPQDWAVYFLKTDFFICRANHRGGEIPPSHFLAQVACDSVEHDK
jgi:hypothetical protein